MRSCTHCKQAKPLSDYYHVNGKPMYNCRDCKNKKDYEYYHKKGGKAKVKARRAKDVHRHRERDRQWRRENLDYAKGKLLQKYWPGSTWQEALNHFKTLQQQQNNLCKICKKPETRLWRNTNTVCDLCVDHCHLTGRVRGLLCDGCNVLIARAKDSPETCEAAAEYLREAA